MIIESAKLPVNNKSPDSLKYKKTYWTKSSQIKGANKQRIDRDAKVTLPQLKFLMKDANEH